MKNKRLHITYYKRNHEYQKVLNEIDVELYSKYIDYLWPSNRDEKIIDVGCGTGTVLTNFKRRTDINNLYGIDVSKLFVENAKNKGLKNVYVYNGNIIPFNTAFFGKAACFAVLEHVANPENVIREMVRVTKNNGKIIIAGPNFLRVIGLKAEHPKVKGIINSIKNLLSIIKKYFYIRFYPNKIEFAFMKPIKQKTFKADDDAICVTNPIDVKFFLRKYNVEIIYQSGLVNYHRSRLINLLSHLPIFNDMFGGYFIVGKKNN